MERKRTKIRFAVMEGAFLFFIISGSVVAEEMVKSSYSPVVMKEPFSETMTRMKNAKDGVMQRQEDLLNKRYDLSNRPAEGVMMSGGTKAVQEGVRVKLPAGVTWEQLATMTPVNISSMRLKSELGTTTRVSADVRPHGH